MLYRVHLAWVGFKLTTSVVIGTDCIGSCKSNYHITMMAPQIFDWQFKFTDESMLFHWNCIEIYAKLQYEMPQAWNIIFCQWIKFVKFQRMFHGLIMSGIHRKKKKNEIMLWIYCETCLSLIPILSEQWLEIYILQLVWN